MIDLLKITGSDFFFDIVEYVRDNPLQNASSIARKLDIHIVTVQRSLDTLEKYGFIATEEKKGMGRPSKIYSYKGGSFTVNINELLEEYGMRKMRVRESGNPDIAFSFDVDKEIVNAILAGGKNGKKIKLDNKEGRFMWLVPPPDSEPVLIEDTARAANIPIPDAIRFLLEIQEYNIVEIMK
jgi:predicted transcriptional regulator